MEEPEESQKKPQPEEAMPAITDFEVKQLQILNAYTSAEHLPRLIGF